MIDAVLGADASKLPAVVGVDLGAQGYVVAASRPRCCRAIPPMAGDEALRGQYAQAWAEAEMPRPTTRR